jgi:hypothetical protein
MWGLLSSLGQIALPKLVSFAAKKIGGTNFGAKLGQIIANPDVKEFAKGTLQGIK